MLIHSKFSRVAAIVMIGAMQVTVLSAVAEQPFVTSKTLPSFTPSQISNSKLNSIGSDSMDSLMKVWFEQYAKHQKEAELKLVSRGSASAPAALIEGTADLGPMARPMKSMERSAFMSHYGFEPTSVVTAYAAVAIYVAKDNPLKEITLAELDAIFSDTSARAGTAIATWASLGVRGPLASEPLLTVGRAAQSPVSFYFKQRALLQGAFSKELMETATLDTLVQSIAAHKNAIGFGEAVEQSDRVKMLAVKEDKNSQAVLPTYQNITSGKYPLARPLSVSLVRSPGESVDPELKDFIQFVLSKEGQAAVEQQGLVPLSAALRKTELTKIQ